MSTAAPATTTDESTTTAANAAPETPTTPDATKDAPGEGAAPQAGNKGDGAGDAGKAPARREFSLAPTDAERAAYEKIRGKGPTLVKPPGTDSAGDGASGADAGAAPAGEKRGSEKPASAEGGKPKGGSAAKPPAATPPETRAKAENTLAAWGVDDPKGQRTEWSKQAIDPAALDLAKRQLRRYGMPWSAIEKLSPHETMEAGAHQYRTQQGLDRLLRVGNTHRATPTAPASNAGENAGDERGAANPAAGESDTDDAAEPSIEVTDADLSPAHQAMLDAVIDPDQQEALKAELLKGIKAVKIAEHHKNRASKQKTAAQEDRKVVTETQQRLLYSRLTATRDELQTRFPGLSDDAKWKAVLERMDKFADGLSYDDPPDDQQLESWMTEACGAVFVGELEEAARARSAAAQDLEGQMSQAGPRSAPVENAGMSPEDAAYHARKQAGSDQKEYQRLYTQFVSPAARRRK